LSYSLNIQTTLLTLKKKKIVADTGFLCLIPYVTTNTSNIFFNSKILFKNQIFVKDEQRLVIQRIQLKTPYISGTLENENHQRHPYTHT
jgi:hypothetical protein